MALGLCDSMERCKLGSCWGTLVEGRLILWYCECFEKHMAMYCLL